MIRPRSSGPDGGRSGGMAGGGFSVQGLTLVLFGLSCAGLFAFAFTVRGPASAGVSAGASGTDAASGTPRIAATIFPLYDIARNVAGDAADVTLILPPGASPHTYEPTPSQVARLSGVAAVYAVGHGLDGWVDTLVPPGARVTVDQGIALRPLGPDSDEKGDADPHYWLTMPNAERIARTIASDLETRFPDRKQAFETHLTAYLAQLDKADAQMRDIMSGVGNRDIVTFHDSIYYFAAEYGLQVVGTFEPTAGREPTPKYLADLTRALKLSGSTVMYGEPAVSTDTLRPFIRDNGLRVATLSPAEAVAPGETFISIMLANAAAIRDNQ